MNPRDTAITVANTTDTHPYGENLSEVLEHSGRALAASATGAALEIVASASIAFQRGFLIGVASLVTGLGLVTLMAALVLALEPVLGWPAALACTGAPNFVAGVLACAALARR
jgi:hypothetical protein